MIFYKNKRKRDIMYFGRYENQNLSKTTAGVPVRETWRRNLTTLWLTQFFAMVGLSAVVPFLPLFIRELGVQNQQEAVTWSGLVFAAPFFVTIFITPFWGAVGDKYGMRIMVIRAVIGLGIAQILMAYAQSVEQLFFFRILQGALSGFYPSAMTLIASNTPEEKQGYALGAFQSANTSGNIFGPVIGGFLSVIIGFRSVFVASAIISFMMAIVLYYTLKEEVRVPPKTPRFKYLDYWKFALTSRSLMLLLTLIFLASFGVAFIRPLFVFFIETMVSDSKTLPGTTGALYSLIGIFSAFSSFWFGKRIDTHGSRQVLFVGTILTGTMYIAHFFVTSVYLLIPVRILLGLGYGVILPALFTGISHSSPPEKKGGLMGIASSAQTLGNMLAPLLSGVIASLFSVRASFIFAGVVFLLMLPFAQMQERIKENQ
ncbi:MAG: MFS transporter [Ignavibacteriales bacterium]|nr:MAG: MFS transporter [Ignavibacteriales bacterium]